MQDRNPPLEPADPKQNPHPLYVRLRLTTRGNAPLLRGDIAQVAATALTARARMQRCRVLAIACGDSTLHAVVQFPASLSLSHLGITLRGTSGLAVARALSLARETWVTPDQVWSRSVPMETLGRTDLPAAIGVLHRHDLRTLTRSGDSPELPAAERDVV